jgi:hypothetical protein
VEAIIGEALEIHQLAGSKSARSARVLELLSHVGFGAGFTRNDIRTNSAADNVNASALPRGVGRRAETYRVR